MISVWWAWTTQPPRTGGSNSYAAHTNGTGGFSPNHSGPNSGNSAYDQNPDYEKMLDIEADRDAYDIITWDNRTRRCLCISAMTAHGAPGNATTDQRRRGYTVRYCGDDVFYDPRVGISAPVWLTVYLAGDPS